VNFERLGGPTLVLPRLAGAVWRRVSLRLAMIVYRMSLGELGKGSRVQPGVRFSVPKRVFIGRHCFIWRGVATSADGPSGVLRLDDRVEINASVHLDTSADIVIGEGALISEDAVIYTHDHGRDPRSEPIRINKKIGSDVWIGMRAVIMARCASIGDGAIVGAGAIVVRDVPPGAIVAGNPARIVGWKDGQGSTNSRKGAPEQ
jgi:acetyltransferase-like isoleucine patch superfamily enzyme